MTINMLRLPEVTKKVKLSQATIYRLMSKNEFPKAKKIGGSVLWIEKEIDDWILSK